jgi:hypothetical protein
VVQAWLARRVLQCAGKGARTFVRAGIADIRQALDAAGFTASATPNSFRRMILARATINELTRVDSISHLSHRYAGQMRWRLTTSA